MKSLKILLFLLLLMLAAWGWGAEIHDAAFKGDLAKVKELLARDPSLIDARGQNEKSPLHWAAQGNQLAVAKYLLAKGAAVDGLNIQKETALVYAAEGGHLELARLLISRGADVNVRTSLQASPIHYALWAERTAMVKLLLKKGADYKWDRGTGFSLLHEAANHQSPEIVALLLQKGMAVDRMTDSGATPLHFAAMHGPAETVSLLIAKGADVNSVSTNGWWPLGLAVNRGHLEMVSRLLAAGAEVNRQDKESRFTPLHMAAIKGYGKICALLIEKGADVNAQGPDNRTPLYYAARYQHQGVCSLLKEKGGTLAEKPLAKNWLDEPLAAGHAVVWYLGHSGWAVKTRNHVLIFDYWKRDAAPDEPGLANGTVHPLELRDSNVTVFASHAHGDHYMPEIFAWQKAVPKITYITGFRPDRAGGYTVLPNREKQDLDGLEIMPIESNDSGQGYFIKADGVTIFHPGDHANRQRDFSGPFKKEIDFLADLGLKADILFAPVSGCGFGDIVAVKKGVYYTIDRLSARCVFPMHAGGNEARYREFAKEAKNAGHDIPFGLAEFGGDHFIVTPTAVRAAFDNEAACKNSGKSNGCR
jgi:ankyrin repeat protein/L-ascorbate metabolism protein UlaG (beta-lactamase superfamily)